MTFKQAVTKSGLTMEQVKAFQDAALRTWQYIGYDILTSLYESTGEDTIPKRDVIEIVLDANYMDRHLKDTTVLSWKNQSYKTMPKDHFEVQNALLAPVFPFKRYGM